MEIVFSLSTQHGMQTHEIDNIGCALDVSLKTFMECFWMGKVEKLQAFKESKAYKAS